MGKTLLYRIFKTGRVPKNALPRVLKEGIVLRDEGIGGSITFRKYRAPGRYHGWARSWFSGSVVLTRKHFLAFRYSKPVIGVAWGDPKVHQLQCGMAGENTLRIRFDPALFDEESSGNVELRYKTSKARAFLDVIQRYTAGNSGSENRH